jgi:ELWxxDGT repeat protein
MKHLKSIVLVVFVLLINTLSAQNLLSRFTSVGEMCESGGTIYFVAEDGVHGSELWKTDGTRSGTRLVKDINLGYPSSNITNLIAFNNEIYFSANDGIFGFELWKSDGTPDGTVLLKNIKPETLEFDYSSNPSNFRVFNNAVYFTAADEWNRADIWKTDGTENGTVKVYETEYSDISNLTVVNNALFFVKDSGHLFVTDGTSTGTHEILVDDYYIIDELIKVDNKLFFITNTSYRQQIRLYALNPGDDRFVLLREYNSVMYGSNDILNMTEVNNELYYSIQTDFNTDTYTDVLWKSDGTVAGTDTIRTFTFDPYWSGQNMSDFVNYNNKLYFSGKFSGQYTLSESDGTYEGTKAVTSITLSSDEIQFTISNNLLYFIGFTSSMNKLVFRTDGTSLGTKPYDAINAGVLQAPASFFNGNEKLYYTADDSDGFGLWNNMENPEIKVLYGSANIESGQKIIFNANATNPIVNKPIMIKNTGLANLFISGTQISGGDFYLDGIDRIIPPNSSCVLTLTFYPVFTGKQTGKLKIYSNDATEGCFEILLDGSAEAVNNSSGILPDNISLRKSTGTSSDNDVLFLSNSEIAENMPVNSIIGALNLRNNPSSNISYTLVPGIGDNDNSLFHLANNNLLTSEVFDYETRNTFSIRVKATSSTQTIENYLLIRITDINEPLTGECEKQFYDLSFALNDVDFATDDIVFTVGGNGTILKSTDSGKNWIKINSGTTVDLAHVQFVTSQVGYILGNYYNDVILKTENGGDNWFPLDLNKQGYYYLDNIYFVNELTGFVIGQNGQIFKTSDGGQNWSFKEEGFETFRSVFFINDQEGYICGSSNKLIKTVDGGTNWVDIDMDSFGYSLDFYEICFTNAQTGYILAEGGKLIRTTDGGQTWSLIYTSWMSEMMHLYFVDENVGYMVGGWNSTAIFKTTDAGITWSLVHNNYIGGFGGISMNSNGTKGCVSGDGSGYGSTADATQLLIITEDSGNSWQCQTSVNGNYDFKEIKFFNDTIGYLFTNYGSVAKTHDGGITWQELNNNVTGYLIECHYFSVDTIFMVTSSDVKRTVNGGASWTTLPNCPGYSNYCFLDNSHFFYTNDGDIYETENGGQTWSLVYTSSEFIYKISYYNEDLIIALGMNVIVTSKDGGNTWSKYEVDSFVTILQAIYYIDENNIIVGGLGGVLLKSTDGGLNWTRIYTSIKADIVAMDFFDEMNGISLSSYDGGGSATLHSTSDGGITWMPFYFWGVDANSMCVIGNNNVYLCGDRGSILRYSAGESPSAASYITGENVVCINTKTEYQVDNLPTGEYYWEVIPTQDINFEHNKATVEWSQPGIYHLKAVPQNGCGNGLPRVFEVLVQDMESASIMGDDSVLQHEANVTYISDAGSNIRVNWQVLGEENYSLANEQELIVTWNVPPTGEVNLVHTSTETGCRQSASLTVYIFGPENINDELQKMHVMVYPNPTTAILNITHSGQDWNLTYSLFNGKGELLLVNQINDRNTSEINLGNLSSGVYILKISNSCSSTSLKVIKQ